MNEFSGKVALVTGGSRGIGAAIARRLAAGGAEVTVTYAREAARAADVVAAITAAGGKARAHAADNRDAAAVEGAVALTFETAGRLDILVNNAGIYRVGPIEALGVAEFDETMAVNLRAAFVASRAAAAHMGTGGRIVSIGSNLALRSGDAGLSLYSMSKAALSGMTRGLARDLGARGITVNLVHPGSTDTDMNPAQGPDAAAQAMQTAIGRFNTPDEVAGLVAWLAGPGAGAVTGAEFTIDGGANA